MLHQDQRAEAAKMAGWEKVSAGLKFGGYVAWEAAVASATGQATLTHVPVFVRLMPVAGGGMAAAIDATLALPGIVLARLEREQLLRERALSAADVRFVAFCPRAMLGELPEFWKVLHVGPGQVLPQDAEAPREPVRDLRGDVPVLGVIDDGIGFLNARFRKSVGKTRIRAVWLQTNAAVSDEASVGWEAVPGGRVLTGASIDECLRSGEEEAVVYRQMNAALFPRTGQPVTNRRVAHGTHVLDLAAGAAPWGKDPIGEVPIFAVQLPPAAIRDTAGRRMETNLVQGLRWILAKVVEMSAADVPPVVINISVGSLAGPGDETAFLANWFRYEVERHERLTSGGEVRLVIAYGNARLSRLVARAELRRSAPVSLTWRVLPDDHSSSFLELRVDAGMTAGLELALTPPVGSGLPELAVAWPEAGTGWALAGPLAAVSSVAEAGGQALLHLALGPTVGAKGLPASPSGAWRVEVRTTLAEPVRLTAKVQRDDTPPGYRTLGRQSWLDHPQGWDWDDESRAYLAPRALSDAPGCPVTREGSGVAYAGVQHPHILFVGSARPRIGLPGEVRPAVYSSEGVVHLARQGESRGPTLVARGDDGVLLPGRAAAGVLSGSVARISGTSMAAPMVARALLRYFLLTPISARNPMAERHFLTGDQEWEAPDPRLGQGVLV